MRTQIELAHVIMVFTHCSCHNAQTPVQRSAAARSASLRYDAAEAVLIGLWGVLEVRWLDGLPAELRRGFPAGST